MTITLTETARWARLTLSSPVLAVAVLDALAASLDRLARRSPGKSVVLVSSHPTIFLAGAHLGEIADLDESSCVAYANRGRHIVDQLRHHPAPTVAAVHGSCSGGGFDLALACDLVVAGPSASFGHPGVRRGLVTGWGGTVEVPSAIGWGSASHALLLGGNLTVDQLVAQGVVTPAADPVVEAATEKASALAALHRERLEAWRSLRSIREIRRCGIFASPAIIDGAILPGWPGRPLRAGASDRTGWRPGRPHDQDHPSRR